MKLFIVAFFCIFCFCNSYAQVVSNIRQTQALSGGVNEAKENEFLFATFVVINKLSGIKKTLKVALGTVVEINESNIKIKPETCNSAFENNIKNYISKTSIQNIKQPKESAESVNFYGYLESAFLYKNPVQNNLIAINFLNCSVN